MDDTVRPKARLADIGAGEHGQRIDNYLIKVLKGVPKTRIYKAVRSGEVRVNGSRIKVGHKIQQGDKVRIPPIRCAQANQSVVIPPRLLESIPALFEDAHFLVVDKPAGLAVHGGSGIQYGLIDAFRQSGAQTRFLELVHRLDRDTSGCLMLAKTRKALLALQQQLGEERTIGKFYLALVKGAWQGRAREVDLAIPGKSYLVRDGRRTVERPGQKAISRISRVNGCRDSTLVEIELKTGRKHQARIHCMGCGHPIAGDGRYGDNDFNKKLQKIGLGRMFLHAHKLTVRHPMTGQSIFIRAPLPKPLQVVLHRLDI